MIKYHFFSAAENPIDLQRIIDELEGRPDGILVTLAEDDLAVLLLHHNFLWRAQKSGEVFVVAGQNLNVGWGLMDIENITRNHTAFTGEGSLKSSWYGLMLTNEQATEAVKAVKAVQRQLNGSTDQKVNVHYL